MKTIKKVILDEFQRFLLPFIAGLAAYYFALEIIFLKNPLGEEIKNIFREFSITITYFIVIISFLLISFAIYFIVNYKDLMKRKLK
jgi:hypothetical protein